MNVLAIIIASVTLLLFGSGVRRIWLERRERKELRGRSFEDIYLEAAKLEHVTDLQVEFLCLKAANLSQCARAYNRLKDKHPKYDKLYPDLCSRWNDLALEAVRGKDTTQLQFLLLQGQIKEVLPAYFKASEKIAQGAKQLA